MKAMKGMQLLAVVLTLTLFSLHHVGGISNLKELFYQPVNNNLVAMCIRLTNATSQIGCSGSGARGVLYYVDEMDDVMRLGENSPNAPYIVLIEPQLFTGDTVKNLKSMQPKVKGIIVRYVEIYNSTVQSDSVPAGFSPENFCPNNGFGIEKEAQDCKHWNPIGTDLLFTDFGDFPIFALLSSEFDDVLNCHNKFNNVSSGRIEDYPLCSAELTSDMAVATSTPACFRRERLPIPYLNGEIICVSLGDLTTWGSLFNISSSDYNEAIMLAVKLDSVSFFPTRLSFGASSEVAAIATLLAVIDQLGRLKKNDLVTGVRKPILYSFFHGESWDYIGSSRMAYDMIRGKFPENKALPKMNLNDISYFLELGQLGLIANRTIFVHGDYESSIIQRLKAFGVSDGITVKSSGTDKAALPPASLQRFIREAASVGIDNFSGSVLTSFNNVFDNKLFGSRFDDLHNFGKRSIEEVAADLAAVATTVTKAVLNFSEPQCSDIMCKNVFENISASPEFIEDILCLFLSNSSCDHSHNVLIRSIANETAQNRPISRYIGESTNKNLETVVIEKLLSYLTAENDSDIRWVDNSDNCPQPDEILTSLRVQVDNASLCLESFTYSHTAESPAFNSTSLDIDSKNYSTWTESRWKPIRLRVFLVTTPLQEVGFLFLGLFMTLITIVVSIQCNRKGKDIFEIKKSYSVVNVQ